MSSNEVIVYFAKWIEKETGIIYEEYNLYQLQDRIDQLVKHFSLSSATDLWQKAQSGISGEFRQKLIDIATNNETSFFRDPKFFECLEKSILPKIIQERGGLSGINIWSVACSSGQEPYSLSMICADMSKKLKQAAPRILATDISEKILERAKSGKYSDIEVNRGLSVSNRANYFKSDVNNNWMVNSDLKAQIEFQKINLRDSFNLNRQFDLVLCRNVLIYQRVEAKAEIIKKITSQIRPGGIFLMGSGESLIGLSTDYQLSLADGVAVYKRKILDEKAA